MKVLLVEPDYKVSKGLNKRLAESSGKKIDDEILLYPPLGLMKIATYHKKRNDKVKFVRGMDKELIKEPDLFNPGEIWDRVYISTSFTFYFKKTVETINFYKKAVESSINKIFVGGIMASLIPEDIFSHTDIIPVTGILSSARMIDFEDQTNIDLLAPDYDILEGYPYGLQDTIYAYTTKGCVQNCDWCGVHILEPKFISYIDIKPVIKEIRKTRGDLSRLKLMDNNVMASPKLESIVADLLKLGFGVDKYTEDKPKRKRVVDFNQGLDANYFTEDKVKLLSKLNIKPVRIAFDKLSYKESYIKAVNLCEKYGFKDISNYMLYNCYDTPMDLYERLFINIELNEKYKTKNQGTCTKIYSYPMRFAPIRKNGNINSYYTRDHENEEDVNNHDSTNNPTWNKRFLRNIEVMKSAAHGVISPTPSLALRTIGENKEEFLSNLYMPEIMLRYRSKYEKKVYRSEPKRKPGNGEIEKFRAYLWKLLEKGDEKFVFFHNAIKDNSIPTVRSFLGQTKDVKMKHWLGYYLEK